MSPLVIRRKMCRGGSCTVVHAVFEVKATFTGPHAEHALDKLRELNVLQPAEAKTSEAGKSENPNFFCRVHFFELRAKFPEPFRRSQPSWTSCFRRTYHPDI